jgi:hypothetical protein
MVADPPKDFGTATSGDRKVSTRIRPSMRRRTATMLVRVLAEPASQVARVTMRVAEAKQAA